ncbi:MAG: aconitase X [Nitrospirota bacterium]
MSQKIILKGRGVSPGYGEGGALVAKSPIAISGVGIEVETGTFRWKGHELNDISMKDKILIMPTGLGYSGGDWALYAMKSIYGTSPKAIACMKVDLFTASGAILSDIPLVDRLEKNICEVAETGDYIRVDGLKGIVEIIKDQAEIEKVQKQKKIQKIGQEPIFETSISLSDEEKMMVAGEYGEGVRKCMNYLIKLGEAFDAEKMVPIASAHPAACGYRVAGEGAVRFLEWLAQNGNTVRVPATTNPTCVDHERWEKVMKLPEHFYQNQMRMNQAFIKLGFVSTYFCSPYWSYIAPKFGEHVAWGEHNAVCYANSVLGARTNFEAHATAIPAAITGRIPAYGLHLVKNRKAQAIVRVETEMKNPTDWMCLGLYVGKILFDRIPVFVDLPRMISNRQLRDLVSSVGPPFGKIPMLHIEGVTPEAPSLKAAFHGKIPKDVETIVVGRQQLEEARVMVSTSKSKKIDLVTLGCPYYCIEDIKEVAGLIEGKKIHPEVQLWMWTDAGTRTVAENMGLLSIIEKAGGHILTDTCAMACPLDQCSQGFKNIVTDSAKTAGFISQGGRIGVYMGSMEECIETALSGKWRGHKN